MAAARNLKILMPRRLAADADGAEAENHMAPGSGTPEAEHRAETREEQHLIELAPELRAARAGDNLVVGHVALGVHRDVKQQAMRQRKFEVVLFRSPGLRIVGERNELGRAHQIDGHIVLHGARGDSRHDHLEDQHENENGGKETAGGRNGEGAENIVEQNFRAILYAAHAAWPILQLLRLSGGDLDANGKIRWRNILRHARQQHRQLAEFLELRAAAVATFQMFANRDAFFDASRARQSIIEISRQIFSYRCALHGRPSPAELARGDLLCGEAMTRRAAENASPNGDGCGSATEPCEAVDAWPL